MQKVEEIRKEIKLEGFQCKSIKRDVEEWNSTISTTRVKISNLTFKKHKILMDCKINNINIPLLEGTMDKVLLKLPVDSIITEASESSSRQSSDSQLKENELEIDYIIINNSNKNLNEDELRTEIISLKNKQNAIRAELQLSYPKLKV
ncbi:PREDICTED: structural maintenance of chromosomes protein 1B-like [Ceratosolen solmsi marchali]|uniref:Structural maintenance of chromosomes protein 1B-like n=1 Tax=Ceratosolen solmsi marchali TaxID=326594 RepID=A0AAJ7DW21_9HYME|nr:PREDICTED: structural maintenance of chromosomes protein 1B-like [Ceratosolen solmsi marchali]